MEEAGFYQEREPVDPAGFHAVRLLEDAYAMAYHLGILHQRVYDKDIRDWILNAMSHLARKDALRLRLVCSTFVPKGRYGFNA